MLKHILGGLKRKERNEEHVNELHRLNRVIADLKGENARLKGQLDAAKAAHRRAEASAVKAEAVKPVAAKKAAGDIAPKTRIRRRPSAANSKPATKKVESEKKEALKVTPTKRVPRKARKTVTPKKK